MSAAVVDIFRYADRAVRTVLIDGEPWFVASDVARILGYRDAHNMIRRLDEDDRGTHSLSTPGGAQDVAIVSEPGLYAAILGSQVEGARAFKRWLKHEVLPQIRRTGQFGSQIPGTFAEALELAAAKQREIEATQARLAIVAPKAEAFDAFMEADGTYRMDAAAKALADVTGGAGRNTLMKWLRTNKVLMADNTPYQRYAHWFKVVISSYDRGGVEHATKTTYVRPPGLDGIRQMWERSA